MGSSEDLKKVDQGVKKELKEKIQDILTKAPLKFVMPLQTLDESSNHALAECVGVMAEHPECGVKIVCTTEAPSGIWKTDVLCKDLALFRAHSVKQAMVLQGATNVITCVGEGNKGRCECNIEAVDIAEAAMEIQKFHCAHLVFRHPDTKAEFEVIFEMRPLGFEFDKKAPIKIKKVTPGSHGDEKGVKEGWIIERINDTAFTDESNFQAVYDVLVKAVQVCPADDGAAATVAAAPIS